VHLTCAAECARVHVHVILKHSPIEKHVVELMLSAVVFVQQRYLCAFVCGAYVRAAAVGHCTFVQAWI